jgi:hypothetical protein
MKIFTVIRKIKTMADIISLLDVKKALRDSEFRKTLPESLLDDVQKFLNNPGCVCNVPIYRKIMKFGGEQLKKYFSDKILVTPEEEEAKLAKNNWSVINCSIGELEANLKKLNKGRKQIAISRYEDQVTVIINELDILF